jgi:hypothetical protein
MASDLAAIPAKGIENAAASSGSWFSQIGSWIGSLFREGGSIPAFAGGGGIKLPGAVTTRDSMIGAFDPGGFILRQSAANAMKGYASGGKLLAKYMPGEVYFPPSDVKSIGLDNLHRLNRDFASGGVTDVLGPSIVNGMASSSNAVASKSKGMKAPAAAKQTTNVYVVSQDHQPPTTKNDILVAVQSDILQNGNTKKLIKQVMQGG